LFEKLIAAFLRHKRLMTIVMCFVFGGGIVGVHVVTRLSELDPVLYGPESQSIKAFALYELGAYSQAATLYRADYVRVLASQEHAPAHLVATLRRDFSEATRLAEQDLQNDPDNINGLLTLAQVSYDLGEITKASGYIRHVLSLYWDNTDALLLAALIATRDPSQGDPIHFLNTALRTGTAARNLTSFLNVLEITGYLKHMNQSERPYGLLTHYYRVLRIYDKGMTNLIIRTARHAIQNGDHPSESFLSIGLMYDKTRLPFEALEAYQEAVRINPTQALAYHWASGVHSRNYDDPHEYLSLKKAFRAASADRFHITALSNHLSEKHESYAVVQFMKEGLTADPENLTAHAFLASALHTLGERHQAMEVRQRMLALEPHSPVELEQQSWAAEWLGRDREREPLLQKSIRLDSGRPSPHRELARLYKKQDRIPEALKEFEIAFHMGAYDDPQQIQEYCALYQKIGDSGRVQACLQALSR